MSRETPSVLDALFGEIPAEARARYGLDAASAGAGPTTQARKPATTPETAGNGPSSAWKLSRASWVEIAKRVYAEVGRDRVTSVAAGVTFFGLLALFPALTALVSIYGLIFDAQSVVGHVRMLDGVLPDGAVGIIRDQVVSIVEASGGALGIGAVIGVLTALYSANGGMKALIEALNVARFEKESRGFVRLNLVSLGLTLGAIVLVIALLALTAVMPPLLDGLNFGGLTEGIVRFLRWPLMAVGLTVAIAILYRWGPSKHEPRWQWITPGALFATAGLIIASALFSWYAGNFANYNETYGSLGAVVGLMMWLWIASIVVMMGAEINSEVERQVQKENGVPVEGEGDKKI